MKYRKKPEVIEAFQYKGSLLDIADFDNAPKWVKSARCTGVLVYAPSGELFIMTLGRYPTVVSIGDYIIKDVNGELYPCKPDIFEKIHEKVEGEIL